MGHGCIKLLVEKLHYTKQVIDNKKKALKPSTLFIEGVFIYGKGYFYESEERGRSVLIRQA